MEYPIVLLSPWVLHCVLSKVRDTAYSSSMAVKNFVKYESPNVNNIGWTPILRIFRFAKPTDDGALTAVLNDSTHKILALFTSHCIRQFESNYKQRITYCTTNSLLLVKRANLRFVSLHQLREQFGVIAGLKLRVGTEVLIMEVLEVEMFQRDQIRVPATADNSLLFIYDEASYREKSGRAELRVKVEHKVTEDFDEMISD